jgi:hypothetical protein
MENKKMLSVFALGIIALLGISFIAAYQGDYSVNGPNYSKERHKAMEQAFEDLDYDAWVTLMIENKRHSKVMEIVTEDNFATFVEAHEAGKSGDVERAQELRAELGMNNRMGPKDGTGFGNRKRMNKGLIQGSKMNDQGNCPYLK